jgi:uncharacterized damage-inducible protein DinB
MNVVELLQFSLGNTLDVFKQVTEDLTQEQADWTPPGIANSIGALYWHTMSSTDQIVHGWCLGQASLAQKDGWKEKVVVSAPQDKEDHAAQIRDVRVNLPALHEYAQAVAQAIRAWLAALTPEDLERKLDTPVGELSLAQLVESFVVWHISAHCGEISALKGCQGAKGYPF